jgi:Cys-tRNA(Pro) deacylase
MAGKRAPVTNAVRVLRQSAVAYTEHVFDYERYPGAAGAAEYLGVDPHVTAKTIVFVDDSGGGAVVLMHGDLEVSTKKLARVLETKSARPATQREADRITGYQFGGTSPLGMRANPSVVAQPTLVDLDLVYVNAGSKGFLVALDPKDLIDLSGARLGDVAVD